MEEMKNKSFTPPWLFKREGGHHQFKMIVPGITYQLFVGKVMPTALRGMCTARSPKGLIYMSPKTDDVNLQGTLDMLKNSRRVGKLAKRWQAGSSQGGAATPNNTAGIRAAIPRGPRQGEPAESERHCLEGRRAPDPSRACARRQAAGGDHDRGRAATQVSPEREVSETVNNALTVLNVLMRTAVEWDVIERVPCSIKMLRTPRTEAAFYEFDQFERLVEASARETQARLVVLLGGEAGLRRGEMIGLEWTDVNLTKRQLCVARSD
jgi:hypothetical protein